MIQNGLNDKEEDIQGLKKGLSSLLNCAWEKGYASGFDDGLGGKMMDERIKKIAEFYGKESQLDILQEECAELVQAISKYRRGGSFKLTLEEIADVEIMIEQIKYLNTDAENQMIDKIREGKLDRQIQRIIMQQEAGDEED